MTLGAMMIVSAIGVVILAIFLFAYDAWVTKKELEEAEKHGKTTEENTQM